jgi:hypothetical protein
MDKRIRINEICIIGQPRCDFVFSSTRNCFIAYGFRESTLEMTILRNLLNQRGLEPIEAGGSLAPGQNAFCAKICSKIIISQFCIVLLNNEVEGEREIPNANVNMEYGLMLGFNKYVIPFQKSQHNLPFNVAGLDTIKYTDQDIEQRAITAIDQAIIQTRQEIAPMIAPDQMIDVFLLSKKALVTQLINEGEKAIYQLGAPLGFNLLNDFSGLRYIYFGIFTALRPEIILWRLHMLKEILDGRRQTIPVRIQYGVATSQQGVLVEQLLDNLKIWIVVTSDDEKPALLESLRIGPIGYPVDVFSLNDVRSELTKLEA